MLKNVGWPRCFETLVYSISSNRTNSASDFQRDRGMLMPSEVMVICCSGRAIRPHKNTKPVTKKLDMSKLAKEGEKKVQKKKARRRRAFRGCSTYVVESGWMTGVIDPITTNHCVCHTFAVSES